MHFVKTFTWHCEGIFPPQIRVWFRKIEMLTEWKIQGEFIHPVFWVCPFYNQPQSQSQMNRNEWHLLMDFQPSMLLCDFNWTDAKIVYYSKHRLIKHLGLATIGLIIRGILCTEKSRFNEWPPSAPFHSLNRDFTLNQDFLKWNFISVTSFCS